MSIFGGKAANRQGFGSWLSSFAAGDGGSNYSTSAQATMNGITRRPEVPEIWKRYDQIGDYRSDARFFGACLSRCLFRLGWLDEEGVPGPAFDEKGKPLPGVPVPLAKCAAKMIASIRTAPGYDPASGPAGGHSLILGQIGVNLFTVSECYLTITETPTGDHWEVLSTMEMVPQYTPPGQEQRFTRYRANGAVDFVPDFYQRIWLPHPVRSDLADSAGLPLLPTLERLYLLQQEGLADSKSRLKGPGALFIPPVDWPGTEDDPKGHNFVTNEFHRVASTGIKNPASASAQVPLVFEMPEELIKSILHLRFDYNDDALIEKRSAAVGDLARGVPLPYESTVGYSNTSFANSFAIDEQLARIYIAPPLDLITGFLTGGWLIPGLMGALKLTLTQPPPEDVRRFCVWHDMSGLTVSPDPTKVAMWAHGNATNPNRVINAKGVRRLMRIPEGEAPSDEEWETRVDDAQKLRARSEQGEKTDTEPEDGRPKDDPDGERDKDEEVGKRVLAVAESVVILAVERAGSKLLAKVGKRDEYKALLAGVAARDVARKLGPQVVESLGGTGPLLNGAFAAFETVVTSMFDEIGRTDAADLAAAARRMAEAATLARLWTPAARIAPELATGFLDLLSPSV